MTQPVTGAIRVSANGRYFTDEQGRPFFWLGDTAWPLFGQYTRQDAEAYLDNRARLGFTVIQCVLAWGGGTGFESPAPGPNCAGNLPWIDNDPTRPNDAYFQPVDYLVRYAAEHGLVLAMLPAWGYYFNNVKTLNTGNARVYGKWLGERYKNQPNIVWVNGGDRNPSGFEDVYRALAHGLREGDGGRHLITFHPCGWTHSSQWYHHDDWLDFNMIQTWTEWAKIHPAVTYDMLLQPAKPVVLAEGAYENGPEYPQGPISPLIVRRQAWWAFLAGGYFTYGQDSMWRMQPGWTGTFDTPGALAMAQLKTAVMSRPWWKRMPDQGLFASGVNSERTLNAAARTPEGDRALVYMSSQCHVLLQLDRIQARRVQITLVNPANGQRIDAGVYETSSYANPQYRQPWFTTPAFWEDALLVLDALTE